MCCKQLLAACVEKAGLGEVRLCRSTSGGDRMGRLWPSSLVSTRRGQIPEEPHANVAQRKPGQAPVSSRWD